MSTGAVVITGASTGIGRACALHLDRLGYRVFAGIRKEEDAESLREAASGQLEPLQLDVTRSETIAAAVEAVQTDQSLAPFVGLVNNAGINVSGPCEFVPLERFRQQFEVNFFGQVAVTQAFLPLLRQSRGRIVNVSSLNGRLVPPFLGPYGASKFALEAFSDALRRELRPHGVQVSVVQPGAIRTPIWKKGKETAREMMQGLPPEAVELYGRAFRSLGSSSGNAASKAIPPERVATAVEHALSSSWPRCRYLVGTDAWVGALLAWLLPDRVLDFALRKLTGG